MENDCELCGGNDDVTDQLVAIKDPDVPDHVRDLSSRFKTVPLCVPCFDSVRRGEIQFQE